MRRILCLCVAITLLVGLLPKVAFATTPVTSYSDLQAAISAAPATGVQTVIELQNSFSATGGAISIAAGQNILLTSAAGSTFTFTQATSGQRHFSVAGNLTLQNVTLSGPGGGTTAIVGGVDVSGGTLTLASGGTITNCRAPGSNSAQYGGGVNVHNQGTLIMNGGTISNNASAWVGGGVLLAGNSTFTMNSGTISGNTSVTSGGGVAIQNGYGTISGGTITGNIATASNSRGGGVSLSAANLTMTGGSITNNRANNGGGIYTDASGFITINAGTLSNNTATSNGGAIYTAQYTSNNPLPPNSYINLVINSSVVFTDNVAGSGARIPPANVGTMTHISTTYNSSIYANPLNNLDINYFGAAGVMVTYLTVTFTPGAYGTFPPGTQTQQNVPTTSAPLIPTSVPTAQPIVNYGFIGWSADGGATVLTSAQVLTTPISDNTTYVAQYAPPITLTFDAQGGTPAIQTVTPVQVTGTYANALLQVTNPTYAGHVFRGWFTAPGGVAGAVQILPTSIVTSQVNQTLYAWWVEDPTVTITFDAQGGTPPMQVVSSRVVGSPYTATLAAVVTPTLSDMAFAGWWTTPNGDTSGTQITAADTIPDGNTTVYAHWIEIPTIEIIFNAQGGTPDGQNYSLQTGSLYGDALAAITTPTRMGYAFTGWWTTLNGDTSGVQILPNTVVTAIADQILYAHWAAVTVTITFDAQGGTPVTQVVSGLAPLSSYSPVLAAITTPTRFGYTFAGWHDQQQGMGGSTITSGSIVPPSSSTVYAWWTPIPPITVTFDAQSGTPALQYGTVIPGDTYSTPMSQITTPTRTGYIFNGWYTQPSGTPGGVQILSSTVVTTTSNQTLYAHWVANPTITITFDAQSGTPATQIVPNRTYNDTYAATLAEIVTPTRYGYVFQGWYTAPNGGGSQITDSSTIPASDATVYAYWTPAPTLIVTFDAQGGYFDPAYIIPGAGVTLTSAGALAEYGPIMVGGTFMSAMASVPDPTPPSGTSDLFGGWWTAPAGTPGAVQVLPTSTVWDAPGITLYVHWITQPVVTLTFDAQGGTPFTQVWRGAVIGMTELVNDFIQIPTLTGYTFAGWYTASSGGTPIGDYITVPGANTTYYAQWTQNPPITITFDAQGGTPDGQQQQVHTGDTYAEALSQAQQPTQVGNAFTGWWTTPNGDTSGVQIFPSTVVTATADQTLYAHWAAMAVTVTFDAQGGEPAEQVVPGQASLSPYAGAIAAVTTPTMSKYIFDGWHDNPQSMGGSSISNELIPPGVSAVTVYAWWTPAPIINLTFDAQGGIPATQTPSVTVQTGDTYAAALAQIADPTWDGHIFVGWYSEPSNVAGGVQILPTSIVTATADQTIYAYWISDPTVTITFDANGGAPPLQVVPGRISGDYFAGTLAAVTIPTWEEHAFVGWFGSPQITDISIIPSVDTTVTAEWIEIPTITITFDAQGGFPDFQYAQLETGDIYGSILYGAANPSGVINPINYGYIFEGWFTTPNGDTSGVQILDNTVVTAITDQTLYAHWIPAVITVTFDAQGGTPPLQTVTGKVPGTRYNVTFASITQPAKSGYTFIGWFTQPTDGAMVFPTDFVPDADTTLYAYWYPTQIMIIFDALGAAPAMQETPATVYDTYAAPFAAVTTPTMAGNVFVGWYTQLIGGVQVQATDIVTVMADQTLYARFAPAPTPPPTPAPPEPSEPQPLPPAQPVLPVRPAHPRLADGGDTEDTEDSGTPIGRHVIHLREGITLKEVHYAYLIGEGDGRIAPTDFITRAEVATILLRIVSDDTRAAFWTLENPFLDVPNNGGTWFSNSVSFANNMKTMMGFPNGDFEPEQLITRAEVVTLMTRILSDEHSFDGAEDVFHDISGHWARENINLAAQLGWVHGYTDGSFNPSANITRAEFAAIVNSVLGRTTADIDTANMKTWVDNANTNAWFYWAMQIASNSSPNAPARNWAVLQLPNARAEDVLN